MPRVFAGCLGLLGGTFNPVHWGHLRLALEVRELLDLEQVDFLPAKSPPHKGHDQLLAYAQRKLMLELALEGLPGLGILDVESQLPKPSYSFQTLTHLQDHNQPYVFILGSGDFLTLPQWYRGLELPKITDLIVVGRQDVHQNQVLEFINNHWQYEFLNNRVLQLQGARKIALVTIPRLDISASLIRYKFCQGLEIRGLVPHQVWHYLMDNAHEVFHKWAEEPEQKE